MKRDFTLEFKELIKDTLTKSLKEISFKKQNLNFLRSTDNFVQTCSVQRSRFNHIELTSFTINFGFFIPIVYSVMKNTTDLPIFPKTDDCYIDGRTGHLIYGKDYWYELNEEVTIESLTKQLRNDIDNYLVPMFQELQTKDNLLNLVRKKYNERKYNIVANIDAVAILELELGDFEHGKEILISEYKQALIPKLIEGKTVYPDGRVEIRYSEMCINEYAVKLYEEFAKRYNIKL
jgi:hypothetical protein